MTNLSRRELLRAGGLSAAALLAAPLLDGCTSSPPSSRTTKSSPPAGAAEPSPASPTTGLPFPKDFHWGAATSAYQIEGAAAEDGKGPSVWDTFAHEPGRIVDGSTGDVAADHYHRYADDVALMSSLGLRSYRFSVSWPRVLPTGKGKPNPKGLDFYKRLVYSLRQHGIRPVLTLWHWDTPQALQDAGGWENRDTAKRFADYAAAIQEALGDAIAVWLTLNEPKTVVQVGYLYGYHAPGKRDPHAAYAAAHNLLLGHGLATQAIKSADGDARVGLALNLSPVYPSDGDDPDAVSAARLRDGYENRLYLDPVLKGTYPDDVVADLARQGVLLPVQDGDMAVISAGVDVLGVNYYNPIVVSGGGADVQTYPTSQATWEQIYPAGLRDILLQVKKAYGDVTVSITENGIPTTEPPGPDGVVDDPDRVAYLRDHLAALRQAMSEGVTVEGYHLWSLLDNFEWAEGYTQRWGIIGVDFETLQRTPKASASWYARVIESNRLG